jgi:hypothetical protein
VAVSLDVMWSVRVTVDKAFSNLKEPIKRHSAATMPTVHMFGLRYSGVSAPHPSIITFLLA